ncbi:hypothetical protein CsSME_00034590 [Camellia sinensis var. sinensis]
MEMYDSANISNRADFARPSYNVSPFKFSRSRAARCWKTFWVISAWHIGRLSRPASCELSTFKSRHFNRKEIDDIYEQKVQKFH